MADTGGYNWLYNELKKRYPDWSEDQLLRAAYPQYFANQEAERKAREEQDAAAKQGLIGTGAQVAGTVGGVAGGKYLAEALAGKAEEEIAKEALSEAATEGFSNAAGSTGSQAIDAAVAGNPEFNPLTQSLVAEMGPTPFYVPAAVAIQTALSAKSGYDMLRGKGQWDPKDDPMGAIGRGGLAIATGGLSEVANFGLNGHKSTQDYQNERRGNLAEREIGGLANFEKNSAAQNGSIVRNADAPESAYDYISSLGMYETFGNDWDKYDLATKAKIVKGLMDAKILRQDHGDTLIQHGLGEGGDQAKSIRDQILAGTLNVDPGANPYTTKPAVAQTAMQPAVAQTAMQPADQKVTDQVLQSAGNRSGWVWDPVTRTWKSRGGSSLLTQALIGS